MLSWTNVPSVLMPHGAHLGFGRDTWSSPTPETDVEPFWEHLFLIDTVILSSLEINAFLDQVLVLKILEQGLWSLE